MAKNIDQAVGNSERETGSEDDRRISVRCETSCHEGCTSYDGDEFGSNSHSDISSNTRTCSSVSCTVSDVSCVDDISFAHNICHM